MDERERPVAGDRPVIVVGAGPVGLSAALALRHRGLPATVIEAEPADRVRAGSRAIYTHGETLRILERNHPGLGFDMADHGLVWQTRRTFWRGRELFSRTYPPPDPEVLPPFTSLPQVDTEQHLLDACKVAGVEMVWDEPVVAIETRPDGVGVQTRDGAEWTAQYVVGADGARSAVRDGIGAELQGHRSENFFVIADVAEDHDDPHPTERIFHYEHPRVGRRNVLLVPFTGGWRTDLQCNGDDDPDDFSQGDGLGRWVGATLGERYADRVTWVSTYRFLQVVADHFTDPHHRVLLAGEAAHLFAPFGARGMNSGVVDADAAADAIVAALDLERDQRHAPVRHFADERWQAAQWNCEAAGRALAHMQGSDRKERLKRRVAVALAPHLESVAVWLDRAPYGPRSGPPTSAGSKY